MSLARTTTVLPCAYGKYELLEQIGSGGMAEVFRARLAGIAGFEKIVVVKRLHPHLKTNPGLVQMFVDEAKLAAQVQHKNVVQVFELGSAEDGELYMAMEHVEGTDLKRLLRNTTVVHQRIPAWLSVHVMAEVLDALSYAHGLADRVGRPRNIVHCDVTPENIFLSCLGDIKLGDFGVAKDDARTSDPFPGKIKGKIPYMAPEQLAAKRLDQRSDIFAAGVVLWECLAQRRLFRGKTDAETTYLICNGPRVPPSHFAEDVPKDLDDCVLRALEPDLDRRIGTAHEFYTRLTEILTRMHPNLCAVDIRAVIEPLISPGTRSGVQGTTATAGNDRESSCDIEDADILTVEPLPPLSGVLAPAVASVETADIVARRPPYEIPMRGKGATVETVDIARPFESAKPYTLPHPLWVRSERDRVEGPLALSSAMRRMTSCQDGGCVSHISHNLIDWMSFDDFANAAGHETFTKEVTPTIALLSGTLEAQSLTKILGQITLTRSTGRLTITQPTTTRLNRREIHFVGGSPTHVTGNEPALHLPGVLLNGNLMSETKLQECVHAMLRNRIPLGIAVKQVTSIDLREYRTAIMLLRLESIFRWETGYFTFDQAEAPKGAVPFAPSLLQLMPGLVLRAKTPEKLQGYLLPIMHRPIDRTALFERFIANVGFSQPQLEAVSALGAGTTLEQSLHESSTPDSARLRLALTYAFLELGLIKPRELAYQ